MNKTMLSEGERLVLCIGICVLLLGAVGWGIQLTGGLIAGSGMTNIFLWGLMIAMFAFMVGFGAGAQLVASFIYLRGHENLKPLAQRAAAVGLACVAAAGVAILADLGAIRNILAMIIGLNPRSPLAWDMIAMTAFLILSIVQLVAMARDSDRTRFWVLLAGAAALVLQIVEGLLFSTQLAHAWWATPIMPIDFIAVAFVSGSALLMLIAALRGEAASIVSWLARFCAIAIGVHLVLALADLALVAFENSPVSGGVLAALSACLPLYLSELVLPAIGMALLLTLGKTGKSGMCVLASLLTIAGIFAHRLMLLFPAYNAPSLYLTLSGTNTVTGPYPVSIGRYVDWGQAFAVTTDYAPAYAEWVAALLPIGVAMAATVIILAVMRLLKQKA